VYCKTRSFFNASKYLKSESSDTKQHNRYYAVINGIANRAGKAYAKYLAYKGFNLILIERDDQPLNDLENELSELTNKPII
jgi:short-subunit dehydrogenase